MTSVGSSTTVSRSEALPAGKSSTVVSGTVLAGAGCALRAPMVPDTRGANANPAQPVAV